MIKSKKNMTPRGVDYMKGSFYVIFVQLSVVMFQLEQQASDKMCDPSSSNSIKKY